MNEKTIQYYDEHAKEFALGTLNADMSACRERFLRYLGPGQRVLDAGCGSGRDAAAFLAAGFDVDAFDASAKLCRIASENTGIEVKQLVFEELEGEEEYDGVWACASLLHVDKMALEDVLRRIRRILKDGGVFYASFKYGSGERTDKERYFIDLTEDECRGLMEAAGFQMEELFVTCDVRAGRGDEKWVNAIVRKKGVMQSPVSKNVTFCDLYRGRKYGSDHND